MKTTSVYKNLNEKLTFCNFVYKKVYIYVTFCIIYIKVYINDF